MDNRVGMYILAKTDNWRFPWPVRRLDLTKNNQPKGDLCMKRLLIGGVMVLSCVLALGLVGFAQNNGVTTDPEISAILKQCGFQPYSEHSIRVTSLGGKYPC
jgi:hypothetical protein